MSDTELGAIWPPVREEPPAAPGRGRNMKLTDLRKFLGEHPGEWYKIGEYRSSQTPRQQYAEHGIEVQHRLVREKVYGRYVRLTGGDASVTPLRSTENG